MNSIAGTKAVAIEETSSSIDVSPMGLLGGAKKVEPDPIFKILQAYREDQREHKLDLGIGVYRDQHSASPIFSAVKQAEQWRVENEHEKAYIGPLGDVDFCGEILKLALSDSLFTRYESRLSFAQTPGGVGALRLAFELLSELNPNATLWVGDSTWQVHEPIAQAAGLEVNAYAYYEANHGRRSGTELIESLEQAQAGDAVLLQASCHNPSGLDFTQGEWQKIADLCIRKRILPIVDMAYHGLGLGLEEESQGLRHLLNTQTEMLLCYTCSKNFGLYRERTGLVMAMAADASAKSLIDDQWKQIATRHYFTPPAHGASLARKILTDATLRQDWLNEMDSMRIRLRDVRDSLADAITQAVPQRDWDFLRSGNGMFALFPLSKPEILNLREQHSIYIVDNGRVNLSGINQSNLSNFVMAIASVCAG